MERMAVNPTRMELLKLKSRLVTARRGHKLLKDKRDEMMKQFLEIVRENRQLRSKVETALEESARKFRIASAASDGLFLRQAIMNITKKINISVGKRSVMSVDVPVYKTEITENTNCPVPYSIASTNSALDDSAMLAAKILPELIKLAQMEKSALLLAGEIERTRRRVSALEFVMIPRFEETIRYIQMKLDENERGSLSRLMKLREH